VIRADNDGLRTLVWRGAQINRVYYLVISRFLGPSRPHGPPCLP
jgi:hypothetical protein